MSGKGPGKKDKAPPAGDGAKRRATTGAPRTDQGGVGDAGQTGGGISPEQYAELEAKCKQFEEDVEKERRQRNYFQLQGEKVTEFWEITKRELDEAKSAQRIKEREMEDMEERHQVEIKVYQQQVKHLMLEHTNDLAGLKSEAQAGMKVQGDELNERELELRGECRRLAADLREAQRSHDELVANLKMVHEQQLTRLRQEFEGRVQELQEKGDKRLKQLRDDMELRRKAEVREIEERKNAHINDLMKRHEKAFQEMKAYYNDIFISNADLIKSLKEQLTDLKLKEGEREKEIAEVRSENRRLADPLIKAEAKVTELTQRLNDYEKDKAALKVSKEKFKLMESEHKKVQWENEALIQRYETCKRERDDLYSKFVTAIRDIQQKSGMKNMLLEQRVAAFKEALEAKEAQLGEVIRAANMDPESAAAAQRQVQTLIEDKNGVIRDLQYELAKVGKSHTDMLRTYEAKMEEHGIQRENFGLSSAKTTIPTMSANLVVNPL